MLAQLPDYFTPDTHHDLRESMSTHPVWVAADEVLRDQIVGFVSAEHRYPAAAEITLAAVRPDRHGSGVGTRLVERALVDLAERGVKLVEVKTLDASAGYEPYEATRAFWERRGFVQIDCIDPLPGWQPGNPSAVYVAALGTTRERRGPPPPALRRSPSTAGEECRPLARNGVHVNRERAAWWAITIDCNNPRRVADFWSAVLESPLIEPGPDRPNWLRLQPVGSTGPFMNFQPVEEPKVGKARLHLDVLVRDLDSGVDRVRALGGTHTGIREALPRGRIAVMRDPEGHEFCLLAPPAQ